MKADDPRIATADRTRGGGGGHRAAPPAREQGAERVAELPTHRAVDEEVDQVAEQDAQVDDAGRDRRRLRVEHVEFEDVAEDKRHEDDGHRELDKEEDADDDDEHQRGGVALGQSAALRPPVMLQQRLASRLGRSHRVHQRGVQHRCATDNTRHEIVAWSKKRDSEKMRDHVAWWAEHA